MNSLLSISDMQAWYGTSQALFGVDIDVGAGEVVALMGRNGMGKTTTIMACLGLIRPCSGQIRFCGHDISGLPPHRIARLGIGLVPEGRRCFPNLTVRENLVSASRNGPWTLERTCELFPILGERLGQLALTLSGGEQQMLAIGRALMTNPRMLVMDEATEGLAPQIQAEIWSVIRDLKEDGFSILVVDKAVGELLELTDRCVILEKGRTAWSGARSDLTSATIERHLGV